MFDVRCWILDTGCWTLASRLRRAIISNSGKYYVDPAPIAPPLRSLRLNCKYFRS